MHGQYEIIVCVFGCSRSLTNKFAATSMCMVMGLSYCKFYLILNFPEIEYVTVNTNVMCTDLESGMIFQTYLSLSSASKVVIMSSARVFSFGPSLRARTSVFQFMSIP